MTTKVAYPPDPATTVSATLVMAGLGVDFVAAKDGNVLVIANSDVFTATGSVPMTVGGRYGTGNPPANGDPVTGSRFGASTDKTVRPAGTTGGVGLVLSDIIYCQPGLSYWFDLCYSTTNAADAATLQSVGLILVETIG